MPASRNKTWQCQGRSSSDPRGGPNAACAPPSGGSAWFRRPAFLCALLAIATLVLYARAWDNGFVDYDDADYVTANLHVQRGITWEGIRWAFTTGHASNWHPLTWVSHMLDVQLAGLNAGGHHLMSVCIHIANTLLLFWFLKLGTGSVGRSALVAALFALHPLHVESVAWVSERKDVLSGLFFFVTCLLYVAYAVRREGRRVGRAWICYVLTLLAYALGLMSKPMLVTVPFVLLLLDYWPLGRWPSSMAGLPRKSMAMAIEKVPFLILAAGSSIATFLVQREGGAVSAALTMGQRLSNAVVSYGRYIRKMVWPQDLSVLYPHPGSWPAWTVAVSGALIVAMTLCVLFVAWRNCGSVTGVREERHPLNAEGDHPTVPRFGYLLTGWFWFLGMMVPVIGIVQVGIQSMADRYTYLPMTGLFVMIVWGARDWVCRRVDAADKDGSAASIASPRFFYVFSAVFLLVLCAATFRQIGFWRNTETLFTRAVNVTKDNYLACNNLGFFASKQGRVAESISWYEKSLQIKPDYEDALNNMGYGLARQRRYREAVPYYERALRLRPKHVEVHNNLGNALSELGQLDAAISHYRLALGQNPEHADAHNNLAIALAMQGNFKEAIGHFERTLTLNPTNAGAHSNLGNAYAIQRQFNKAIENYQRALQLNPADAQAHNNLGNVLMELDRTPDAIEHYQRSIELNPDNPEGHYNLGLALLRQSRRDGAIDHFQAALRLNPGYEAARKQIAALQGM